MGTRKLSAWDKAKRRGSNHYKTKGVEPIDLFKAIVPHPSLTAMEVKAYTDNIKYSFRMLTTGSNDRDIGKILHYTELAAITYHDRTFPLIKIPPDVYSPFAAMLDEIERQSQIDELIQGKSKKKEEPCPSK